MTRILVEERGRRRAYEVGEGLVTIGGGAAAMLELATSGFPGLHAEMLVQRGVVKLRVKPGAPAVELEGVTMGAEFIVPAGATVHFGDAKLTVVQASRSASADRLARWGKQAWERSSDQISEEASVRPHYALLFLAPAAIVAFLLVQRFWNVGDDPQLTANAQLNRALLNLRSGMYEQVLSDLDAIGGSGALSEDLMTRLADLRARAESGKAKSEKDSRDRTGSEFLTAQIVDFEEERLLGRNDPYAARAMMKKIAEFQRRWPDHPQWEWVKRLRDRYADMVDDPEPASYADMELEFQALTWANPRNYAEGFSVLDRWLETARGSDRLLGLALFERMMRERQDWFEGGMYDARTQYDRGLYAQAVRSLVAIICFSGDAAMSNQAAAELVRLDLFDLQAAASSSTSSEWWPALSANPVIANWIKEHPLGAAIAQGVSSSH